jgi:threonine synthase
VAVGEDEMLRGMADLARNAGCFACPEGGATLAALRRMRAAGEIGSDARVVLFNTGSGLKYLEAWRVALALLRKRSRPRRAWESGEPVATPGRRVGAWLPAALSRVAARAAAAALAHARRRPRRRGTGRGAGRLARGARREGPATPELRASTARGCRTK